MPCAHQQATLKQRCVLHNVSIKSLTVIKHNNRTMMEVYSGSSVIPAVAVALIGDENTYIYSAAA